MDKFFQSLSDFFNRWSRQALASWLPMLVGTFSLVGIDLPLDTLLEIGEKIVFYFNGLVENVKAFVTILFGAFMLWYRKIARSPLASGLAGWFGKRPAVGNLRHKTADDAIAAVRKSGMEIGGLIDVTASQAEGVRIGHVLDYTETNGVVVLRIVRDVKEKQKS